MSAAEEWERRRAAGDLARLLRGQRDPGTAPDPDIAAAEFLAVLASRGWRWLEVLDPRRQARTGPRGHLDPDARARLLEDIRHSPTNRNGDNYQETRHGAARDDADAPPPRAGSP